MAQPILVKNTLKYLQNRVPEKFTIFLMSLLHRLTKEQGVGMKKIVTYLIAQSKSLLFFVSALVTAYKIYATAAQATSWLTYRTAAVPTVGFVSKIFILVWHLLGSGIWMIPVSLVCMSVTFFVGMRLYYEHYCAALLWCMSSALIAGLYQVDTFTTGPGGLLGVYGALWLRTILGLFGARMLAWLMWMSCCFTTAYDVLLYAARLIRICSTKGYDLYVRWRTKPNYTTLRDNVFEKSTPEPKITITPTSSADISDAMYAESFCEQEEFINELPPSASSVYSDGVKSAVEYNKPDLGLFIKSNDSAAQERLTRELQDKAHLLQEKLERFGVGGTVVSIKRGPVVTLYEYQPDMDTKISKIIALEDDLALALQALSIRIIAPIPGRSVVGFEVANAQRQAVTMAAIVHSDTFTKTTAQLPCIIGVDTTGDPVVADLARMPHLLIAGSTGSGKSVALNTLLTSLLCSRTPDECRLILIDPKRIEFAVYADIPHLLFPIVTDARTASQVLKWVVKHMEERYTILAQYGVRSSKEFNQRVATGAIAHEQIPNLVVVIDELADLMITAGRDVEESIARIAQMARAAGIHLVVATQRPSVDVITGLIKVNFPSRMAFRVASRIDSRTILDTGGADKLLGKGDMLFLDGTSAHVQRLHGAYVSDEEIYAVVAQIKRSAKPQYKDLNAELSSLPTDAVASVTDGLYHDVVTYLKEVDEISISLLQRKFRIGYNRSARLIDLLEQQGLIMPPDGVRPRKVVR